MSSSAGTVLFARSANSNKRRNRDTSTDSNQMEDEEEDNSIWDDSALVEHYEQSIKISYEAARNSSAKVTTPKATVIDKKTEWTVGAACYAPYAQDECFYKAHIVDLMLDAGMCDVKFDGYEGGGSSCEKSDLSAAETQHTRLVDLVGVAEFEADAVAVVDEEEDGAFDTEQPSSSGNSEAKKMSELMQSCEKKFARWKL